ncbi:unnamed protein product [Prunus armeniaca]
MGMWVPQGKKQFVVSFDDAADVLGKSTSWSRKGRVLPRNDRTCPEFLETRDESCGNSDITSMPEPLKKDRGSDL